MGIMHKFNQIPEFAKYVYAIRLETAFRLYKGKIFNY
jgi:hypothetical protein